jgi:hypothetical protein
LVGFSHPDFSVGSSWEQVVIVALSVFGELTEGRELSRKGRRVCAGRVVHIIGGKRKAGNYKKVGWYSTRLSIFVRPREALPALPPEGSEKVDLHRLKYTAKYCYVDAGHHTKSSTVLLDVTIPENISICRFKVAHPTVLYLRMSRREHFI